VVGYGLPLVAVPGVVGEVGVPHGLRGGGAVLDTAVAQPRHGASLGAVDLELHEFVTVHTHVPGGVDLRDEAVVEFEDAVGGVVGGGLVGLVRLVPTARDVGGGLCGDGTHRAEQVLQHVVPVREHV